jgi:hypothetical protein
MGTAAYRLSLSPPSFLDWVLPTREAKFTTTTGIALRSNCPMSKIKLRSYEMITSQKLKISFVSSILPLGSSLVKPNALRSAVTWRGL